jgi:hypothetical protein
MRSLLNTAGSLLPLGPLAQDTLQILGRQTALINLYFDAFRLFGPEGGKDTGV